MVVLFVTVRAAIAVRRLTRPPQSKPRQSYGETCVEEPVILRRVDAGRTDTSWLGAGRKLLVLTVDMAVGYVVWGEEGGWNLRQAERRRRVGKWVRQTRGWITGWEKDGGDARVFIRQCAQ